MATVIESATSDLLRTPRGKLVFEVLGSHLDGQLIELRSGKCTMGSHPKCTFRICAPGIQPVHCFLLRGRAGVAVRSVSGRMQVNSSEIEEAALLPGDILTVGDISLELAALVQPHPETLSSAVQPPTTNATNEVPERVERQIDLLVGLAASTLEPSDTDKASETEQELEQLRQEKERLTAEVNEAQQRLQEQLAQHEQLPSGHRDKLEAAQHAAKSLDQVVSELKDELQNSQRQRDDWEARYQLLHADCEKANQQLAEAQNSLNQREDLVTQLTQANEKCQSLEQETGKLLSEISRLQEELADARRVLKENSDGDSTPNLTENPRYKAEENQRRQTELDSLRKEAVNAEEQFEQQVGKYAEGEADLRRELE